jgi:nucleotide-binding universal stress UspA family protein
MHRENPVRATTTGVDMNIKDHPTKGPDTPAVPRNEIVVGIDHSPASAAALRWAAEQSKATETPMRLVNTWQLSAAASAAVISGAAEYLEAASGDARARATRWVLDTLGGDTAQVRWTLEVHEGGAGPVLVTTAHGARMLVVGTHEHTGLRRAVSGSVSHYALSHADVPVVAVPAARADVPMARSGRAAPVGPLL